jgi:hypothetical protein
MNELIHLLIIVIVLCVIAWVINQAPIPPPYTPIRWVLYVILLFIALFALLPFLGLSVPR